MKPFILSLLITTVLASTPHHIVDHNQRQSIALTNFSPMLQEELRKELLQLMGVPKEPRVKVDRKRVQSVSNFMHSLYEHLAVHPDTSARHDLTQLTASTAPVDAENMDTVASFVNLPRKARYPLHNPGRVFYFDFHVQRSERVESAVVRLFKEPVGEDKLENFTLRLHSIMESTTSGKKNIELESTLILDARSSGWITLDVTKSAQLWSYYPFLNSGLYLYITDHNGHVIDPESIGIVGSTGDSNKQAFMVAYMGSNEAMARRKRALRKKLADEKKDSNTGHKKPNNWQWKRGECRLHDYYINLRSIGFNDKFLIAPEGYNASFCAGRCQYPTIKSNATNHAIVQMLVHTLRPEIAPEPCCVPKDYHSIKLLYYDNDFSVKLKLFKDMIALTCGCQ